MINPEFKKEWIGALRSGKYEQGHRTLRDSKGDKFCCLGVACDLFDPSAWVESVDRYYSMHGHVSVLPARLSTKIRLTPDQQDDLIRLNDDKKLSFDKIADWIEENL
jgi:hypothetical protein